MSGKTYGRDVNVPHVVRRYAVSQDFCAIFEEEMNRLYSLALLLTGEHGAAEACFMAALEDCRHGAEVFRDWAGTWSRRAIVKQAIRRVHPRPAAAGTRPQPSSGSGSSALFELPVFERFVFAMTVLERYGMRESALLLECQAREVEAAQSRALRFLGAAATSSVPSAALDRPAAPSAVA